MSPTPQHFLFILLFGSLPHICHTFQHDEFTNVYEHEFHCDDFLNNTLNDEAMTFFYRFNNRFIRWLSRPFQAEQLFPGDSLSFEVLQKSVTERTGKWIEHEQWLLLSCAILVVGSALFTLVYLFYRCIACCCRRSRKIDARNRRFADCKRVSLNMIFCGFVVISIFAAVTLLMCSQYATHSVEQLPDRLNTCVGDLAIYKSNTKKQVERLLTDDFQSYTDELFQAFNRTGEDIVKRFKRGVSADVFDELIDQETRAAKVRDTDIPRVKSLIAQTQALHTQLSSSLGKMKVEYEQILNGCQPEFASACSVAERAISNLETKAPIVDEIQVPAEFMDLVNQTAELNFKRELHPILKFFSRLQQRIQEAAKDKEDDARVRIQEAADTMARVKDELEKYVNNFNFNDLRGYMDQLKEQGERVQPYVQYAWYASLVVAGIFSFIALCFLFGLLYGCCGSRSTYYSDDCCVRQTGGKFFCCGIWLALTFMFVFSVITAAMLLIGANVNNLVCDPWERPQERPDVISFVDRFVFDNMLKSINDGGADGAQRIPENLTLAKIISQCGRRPHLLHDLRAMDKKLQLSSSGFLTAMQLPSDFVTNISDDLRDVSAEVSTNVVQATQKFADFKFEKLNGSDELVSESRRFDLESVDQKLRNQLGSKPYSGSPVSNLLDLMREMAPRGKALASKMIELAEALRLLNLEIETFNQKPESAKVNLAFNNLLENPEIRDVAFLNATEAHIVSLNNTVMEYEEYVRKAVHDERHHEL
ncbi:PRoMiNin (5-transmembrane domain glycoprotein)-like protein [Aphelenchoides fujianensis]|nr:PRoMiNin (5-transmembrane domain glycoprotein)-like protein [Aphelenchoides fujianensis]